MVDVVKLVTVNGEEFTVPNGVTSLRADLIGPGGPSTSTTGGRAGGGGGGAIGVMIAVTPGEVFRAVLGNSIGGGAGFTDFSFTQGDRSATAGGGAPAPTSSSTVGGNGGGSSYSNVTLLYAYTGGKGGTGASTGGGGGGGAAGPNGSGGAGGAGNGTSRNSGGGGGANGGTAGASGPASTTAFAAGGVGANSGGNGGRGDNQASGGAVAGSPGTIFTDTATGQTAGPGGGGGGNRNTSGTGAVPGGQYGGGAGGGGASPPSVPGDGVVILTYTVSATLSAGRASVAVAGVAANLVRGFTLPAAKSAFVAVGVAAGIKRSRLFSVAPGTLRAQGTGAALLAGHVLPAAGVQLSNNAGDGTLRAARRFDAGIAPLAFAGGAAILTRIGRRVLDARSAVIVVVGTSAKLLRTRLIYGEAAAFLWDGVATALAIVRAVTIVAPADRVVRPAARQRLVRSAPRIRVIKITRSPAMLNWPSMHVGEVSDVGIDWTSALETGDTVASATASFSTDAVAVKAENRDGAVHSLRLNAVRSGTVIAVVTAVTTLGETLKDTIRLAVAP